MEIINKSSYSCRYVISILLVSTVVLFQVTTAQTKKIGFHMNSSFSGSIFAAYNVSDSSNERVVQKLIKRDNADLSSTPLPEPINHPCDRLLKKTSEAFGDFYICTISSARPYRFCEDCSRLYMTAINIYNEIQRSGHEKSEFDCKKYLLESDNSPVIPSAVSNILTIWGDAYCDNCFEESLASATANNTNLSNSTLRFLLLYQNLTDCISESIMHDQPVNICKSCHDSYKALNNHFNDIEKISSSTVCMDIMDRMNYTRIQWSKDFNCSIARSRDTVLISSIVIASVTVPIMYYVSAYIAFKGVKIVREKLIRSHNAQSRLNRRHSSYDSIDETHGKRARRKNAPVSPNRRHSSHHSNDEIHSVNSLLLSSSP